MSTQRGALVVLRATSEGLHSVANSCTRSDLATPMRARAEEFDDAATAFAELVEATIEFRACIAVLMNGQEQEDPEDIDEAMSERYLQADARCAAAIARVQGGAK